MGMAHTELEKGDKRFVEKMGKITPRNGLDGWILAVILQRCVEDRHVACVKQQEGEVILPSRDHVRAQLQKEEGGFDGV